MSKDAEIVRKALTAGQELAPAYAPDYGRALAALDRLEAEAKKAWGFEDKMMRRAVKAEARAAALEKALGRVAHVLDPQEDVMAKRSMTALVIARAALADGGEG